MDVKAVITSENGSEGGVRPALKKFAENLKSADLTSRTNYNLNVQRVDDFIHNVQVSAPRSSMLQKSSSVKQLPGCYSYDAVVSTTKGIQFISPPTEFNSALGNKSRYGEGDGSFWDRWLGTSKASLAPLSKRVVDERVTPDIPSQGFKRYYHLAPIDPPSRKNVIRPYAERKSERLGINTKAPTLVDSTMAFMENYSGTDISEVDSTEDFASTKADKLIYFGREAKIGFFEFYRQVLRKSRCLDLPPQKNDDDSLKTTTAHFDEILALWNAQLSMDASSNYKHRPNSPRSKFIIACVRQNIMPRPELLLRKQLSVVLDLSHQRMGNSVAVEFANAFVDLPYLEELNISDNNLEGSGLACIVSSLKNCPRICKLNISENKVDSGVVQTLVNYLGDENTALTSLSLARIKLSDIDLALCLEAVAKTNVLVDLDLTGNLIGSDEVSTKAVPTLNLYSYLASDCCRLHTLNLSWNHIRSNKAVLLGKSLSVNKSLTKIDLSHNRLGEKGGESIGNALYSHNKLQELLLQTNEVTPRACAVLITGALSSSSLKVLNLSQNPIGQGGLRSYLFSEIVMQNNSVDIIMTGCTLQIKDPRCWFDWQSSSGELNLDLSNPYDRAVTIDILRLTSNHELVKLNYFRVSDSTSPMQDVDLSIETRTLPKVELQSTSQLEVKVALMRNLQNFEQFEAKYLNCLSFDEGGRIDKSEILSSTLQSDIINPDIVGEVFDLYDLDCGMLVEREEIKEYFFNKRSLLLLRGASGNLLNYMIQSTDEQNPYVPKPVGKIQCRIQRFGGYFHEPKIISSVSLSKILNFAEASLSPLEVVFAALSASRLDFDDAQKVFDFITNFGGNRIDHLARVLISAASPVEVRLLILRNISTDAGARCQLKDSLKYLYRPLINLANGYYQLDLYNPSDRLCLERLKDLSNSGANYRVNLELEDVSEHKNWSGFWNTVFDGQQFSMDDSWFYKIPKKGRLEFDFVTYYRNERPIAISNQRFVDILISCGISTMEQKEILSAKVREASESAVELVDLSSESYRVNVIGRYPDLKAKIADLKSSFLKKRAHHSVLVTTVEYKKLLLNPDIQFGKDFEETSTGSAHKSYGTYLMQIRARLTSIFDDIRALAGDDSTVILNKIELGRILKKSGLNLSESEIKILETKYFVGGKDFFSLDDCFVIVVDHINGYRSSLFHLEVVEETFGSRHLTCSQLQVLIETFPGATLQISSIGNFRVELVIRLYSRLSDPENIDFVLGFLSETEVALLVIRLGLRVA